MSDQGSDQPPRPDSGGDPWSAPAPGQPGQPGQPPPPPPAAEQPPAYGYGQPAYGQPAYGQPAYGQPAYGAPYGQPAGSPPPNHLVWAILTTVLCCLPLGIASIVFAAQVNGKYAAGDIAGAQESARKAKQFAIWSAIAMVILIVIYAVVAVGLVVNSDSS